MNWIVDNLFIIVSLAVAFGVAIFAAYRFFCMPTEKQKAKVKEWLVWACIEAERVLQSGTGQLKLREVWNMFCGIPAFSFVAKMITFEKFSEWVKDALKKAKQMLCDNAALAEYVYGENAVTEVEKLRKQLEVE